MIRGALWPLRRHTTIDDLYDRRIVVYPNTTALPINRQNQAEYIWMIEDYATGVKLARATEVPLVGAPILFLPGSNLAVVGRIPPGQLILNNAEPVWQRDWGRRLHGVILTSDGECWTSTGRWPPVTYRQQ